MHTCFHQNRVSRSAKTVHINLFAKKLHKFATYNLNFEKSCKTSRALPSVLSDAKSETLTQILPEPHR